MKLVRKTTAAIATSTLYLSTAVQVFAGGRPGYPEDNNAIVPDQSQAPLVTIGSEATVNTVVRWIIIVLVAVGIIAALIWLIIGAIKWIISGGDKEKVAEARGQIIAAIIGLVVLLLAVVILNFVMGIIGAGNILDPKIPSLADYLDGRVTDAPINP